MCTGTAVKPKLRVSKSSSEIVMIDPGLTPFLKISFRIGSASSEQM
jgi:hypothetical protein